VTAEGLDIGKRMKKIRIVFFADTHLGFDYPIKPRVQRRRRGPDFFDNFRAVLAYARQTRPHILLHGGDLFFRARVPHKIVDMVYADLYDFAGEGIPLIIVPGNHERSILPVSLFLSHPSIYVFVKPRTYKFDFDGVRVGLSGFPCERKNVRDKFPALIDACAWNQYDCDIRLLCMHQTIEGAQVGPSNYTFRRGTDVIQQRDLPKKATAVLSGHIHRKQILGGSKNSNTEIPLVIYPGSTERTSFAERDESKGFFEIDFSQEEKGNWEIERLEFIELPARSMEDLVLDGKVTLENLGDFIQNEVAGMPPDAIIRLRCDQDTNPEVKAKVTSKLLREILPENMNYQFSADFRQ